MLVKDDEHEEEEEYEIKGNNNELKRIKIKVIKTIKIR